MKIHYELESIPSLQHTAVTTGTFDGVHLGHKTIIERLNTAAKSIGGESVLLTFYPHPRMVLFPDDDQIKMLNTPFEKEQLLQACSIDHLVVIPFPLFVILAAKIFFAFANNYCRTSIFFNP